jgi:hypothetical protein
MIIQAQVDALQDEVHRLIAKLDESEARVDRLEALLREALVWVPYAKWAEAPPKHIKVKPNDLGDRIEAELGGGP